MLFLNAGYKIRITIVSAAMTFRKSGSKLSYCLMTVLFTAVSRNVVQLKSILKSVRDNTEKHDRLYRQVHEFSARWKAVQ